MSLRSTGPGPNRESPPSFFASSSCDITVTLPQRLPQTMALALAPRSIFIIPHQRFRLAERHPNAAPYGSLFDRVSHLKLVNESARRHHPRDAAEVNIRAMELLMLAREFRWRRTMETRLMMCARLRHPASLPMRRQRHPVKYL